MSKNMSKKLANEKEIEKNRLSSKWKSTIQLVSALNVKNAGGALNSEEIELLCCFYLGEAELEKKIEESTEVYGNFANTRILIEDLKQAFSYLSAALTAGKKSKDKYPYLLQDTILLFAKYYFVIGDYNNCLMNVKSVENSIQDSLPKRSKIILSEALSCKAISMERIVEDGDINGIIKAYEKAGEIALSICVEEDKQGTIKRSGVPLTQGSSPLSNLLEYCLLRPGHLLAETGLIEEAIHNYRSLLRVIETKATVNARKIICRYLAQVILSCSCSQLYTPPPSSTATDSIPRSNSNAVAMSTPRKENPDLFANNSIRKNTSNQMNENTFSPRDEVEETLLILLIAEAMHLQQSEVKHTEVDAISKAQVLNETNLIYDLLIFATTRRDQYLQLSNSLEKTMKLAYEEFNLWYNFGLSLVCTGKFSRALLMFERCHTMQPENPNVLMFCIKLSINHLHEYKEGLSYAKRVLEITNDRYIKASARLAMGICYNNMSIQGKSFEETQCLLKTAAEVLEKARELDGNDSEILFNLAWTQAMSKRISKSIGTLKESLQADPSHLNSLHLLALVLSAQKRYKEALEVLEGAIKEHPSEFSLLTTKVKLTEQCHSTQSALVICHGLLKLWNDLYKENEKEIENEELGTEELSKSPSFSMSKSLNESKFYDTATSIKKMTLVESTSLVDDDTSSIAASIRIEKALSEAPSGTLTATHQFEVKSRSVALLSKLWLITSECFINLEDATEAAGCILEASTIFPLSPDVLYMRGRLNELQSNVGEAIACYESTLSIYPNHKAAKQRVGLLYHERGDCALAEKLLRACILYDSSNHTAWNDLGLVLESVGRFEEAADCFLTSLRLEGTSPITSFSSIPRTFRVYDL